MSLSTGPQYTFPSLEDGSSFRVPQNTVQRRWQFADTFSYSLGSHALRAGGEVQRVDAGLGLGVFRAGRVELVQDFPQFDANGDGQVNDNDLLFAVTLRSGKPDQDLLLSDVDNTHAAFFIQDDWRVRSNLTINLGLRYELDTDVKNIARYDEINPIVQPFLKGERGRDLNNFGPRIGFNWSTPSGKSSLHGGYGIYFDRITLEIQTLERGLDGRALPIEVRAGNVIFLGIFGPALPPFAPSISNPFTGFILPGAGASGINIIDNTMQNPQTQQFNLGIEHQVGDKWRVRLDGIHALGTHFIIGRDVGVVFNPVVGGPDRVVNLESSVRTHYDALLASVERRLSQGLGVRASYAFSKALNYANDDQIPFSNGPIDSNNLYREYGPTPNDQRHRFTLAASWDGPAGFNLSTIWTLASGVPMDILLPSAASRIPELQRNAGGRLFKTAGELNAYLRDLNSRGGVGGEPLPLVSDGRALQRPVRQPRSADRAAVRPQGLGEDRADRRDLQRLQRHQLPGLQQEELLGLRQRARARQRRPVDAGLPDLVVVRPARLDRRRRVRQRRPAGGAAGRARVVLDGSASGPGRRHHAGGRPGHRGRHLPDAGRDGAPAGLAVLAAGGLAGRRRDGAVRHARLRRAGRALPRGRRRLRVPARGVGPARRVSLRLEVLPRDGPRHHGGPGDGPGRLSRVPRAAVAGRD